MSKYNANCSSLPQGVNGENGENHPRCRQASIRTGGRVAPGAAREGSAMARRRSEPAEQMRTIVTLGDVPAEGLTREQREMIFAIAAEPADEELMLRAAILLSRLYPALAPQDPDFAHRTHVILLRDLRDKRKTLAHPSCSWLVMTHLREENLAHIPWQSTEEVASAAECFYGFSDGSLSSEESHRRVRDLVKYAGLHFVRQ